MAGHSHWARIKRKKGATDAKRGKVFSKCARAIMVAVRNGGPDPAMNLALRYAMDDARAANMPRENIERAVRKGAGELGGAAIEEIAYEGYGPGGAAILVETMTDNRNRTTAELQKIFERNGGAMGRPGCVAWIFEKRGVVAVGAGADEEKVMEVALAAGADDMRDLQDGFEVTSPPEAFGRVRSALEEAGLPIERAEITRVPKSSVVLGEADARKVLALLEALDDHDDVQKVHSNFDIDSDLLARIQAG
jgi:YebC/PmpR family DNA-binding regulatory protein